jgi:hypothetical protein
MKVDDLDSKGSISFGVVMTSGSALQWRFVKLVEILRHDILEAADDEPIVAVRGFGTVSNSCPNA